MLDNAKRDSFLHMVRCPILRTGYDYGTSGAIIDADETARLLEREDLHFLAEMMNYPESK